MTSRLTLNLGLRWDVYVPWVEKDNRQSNFDETTGRFVIASDDAVINGVKVGRYLQTYSKRDLGPRFGFAYDLDRQRQDAGPRRLRRVLELHARRHVVVEGAEPAVPAVDGADADPDRLRRQPAPPGRPAGASRRRSEPAGRPATTRSIFDINFRDAYARQWNINVQRSLFTNYMLEVAYVGSQGRHMLVKGDPNQARPVVGVTDANVNRPYALLSPALRTIGQVQSQGHARLQRACW